MGNVSKLHRNLVITFENEEGVDAGAIKAEFFNSLIEEMDRRFFEFIAVFLKSRGEIFIMLLLV
jgi:hypothetical protein